MRIEKDPSGPRKKAENLAEQNRKFVEAQGALIAEGLKEGKIQDVTVKPGTEIRSGSSFDNRMTLGYVASEHQARLAALASSSESPDVALLYIASDKNRSGLFTDPTNDHIYTNSAWVAEKEDGKKVIKHIKTSPPAPLDGITVHSEDKNLDPALEEKQTETGRRIADIADSKYETKLVIEEHVTVPDGIRIDDNNSALAAEKYIDYVNTLPAGNEIVIKPDKGNQGEAIKMGDPTSEEFAVKAISHLATLVDQGISVVVEERIIPPPQHKLTERYNRQIAKIDPKGEKYHPITPDKLDYYFRVITNLEGNEPKVVETEIRYAARSEDPVNISPRIFSARIDALDDPRMAEAAHEITQKAVSAVYRHAHQEGDPDVLPDWVGSDVIAKPDGTMAFLELQCGPGGLGGLAEIDKKSLSSVSEVLLPAQIPYLEEHFTQRQKPDLATLRNVESTTEQKVIQYHANLDAEDFNAATQDLANLVKDNLTRYGGEETIDQFAMLAAKTGDYNVVYDYTRRLVDEYPLSLVYRSALIQITKRLEEQAKKGDEN